MSEPFHRIGDAMRRFWEATALVYIDTISKCRLENLLDLFTGGDWRALQL